MFRSVLKEHGEAVQAAHAEQEHHHAQARAHAGELAGHLAGQLDTAILKIYKSQIVNQHHTKLVKDEIARFQANVATLGELVRSLNDSLREVGDLQNYLEVVEKQAATIAEGIAGSGDQQEQEQPQLQQEPQ
ncbi:hypothetical protein FOA52_002225 [Chlamydomonas sp. UWO 241]|nr:hypothetical protein FOA52_002225 [Chlamydomonas sp. UWO 241]